MEACMPQNSKTTLWPDHQNSYLILGESPSGVHVSIDFCFKLHCFYNCKEFMSGYKGQTWQHAGQTLSVIYVRYRNLRREQLLFNFSKISRIPQGPLFSLHCHVHACLPRFYHQSLSTAQGNTWDALLFSTAIYANDAWPASKQLFNSDVLTQ